MPTTKSAKKRLRQSKTRYAINLRYKRKMKEVIKEIKEFIVKKEKEEAKKILPHAYKIIDKAAKRGIIKKNTASRKKSRLTKAVTK